METRNLALTIEESHLVSEAVQLLKREKRLAIKLSTPVGQVTTLTKDQQLLANVNYKLANLPFIER